MNQENQDPVDVTSAAWKLGMSGLSKAEAKRAKLLAKLEPLAKELLDQNGVSGTTVADLRNEAEARGILKKVHSKNRKILSSLGGIMRRAGGVSSGKVRRSNIPVSHANRHTVWIPKE